MSKSVMRFCLLTAAAALLSSALSAEDKVQVTEADKEIAASVAAIRRVGAEGKGNESAQAAWKKLASADPDRLIAILIGLDDASPLAANWLYLAAETVADRAAASSRLPVADLEKYILDIRRNPRGRRLAFEWLVKQDPAARDRLVPLFADDPGVELRRDAVDRLIKLANEAESKDQAEAADAFQKALAHARDRDQVADIVKRLEKLGRKVDLPRHFGFIMSWKMIGPFDNSGGKGFDVAYPPESEIDFKATYPGKSGPVSWKEHTTEDDYGLVDLAKALAPHKGAITYVVHDFEFPERRPVELRMGTVNAFKVWLNGKLLFGRDEYHRGMEVDQYRMTGVMNPGKNRILIKVCQNEQKEDWAQRWHYQLRVCDSTGTAILSADRAQTSAAIPTLERARPAVTQNEN